MGRSFCPERRASRRARAFGGYCLTMPDQKEGGPPRRQYPAFYEKAVPIALILIVLAVLVLLLVVLVVVLGLFPGAA